MVIPEDPRHLAAFALALSGMCVGWCTAATVRVFFHYGHVGFHLLQASPLLRVRGHPVASAILIVGSCVVLNVFYWLFLGYVKRQGRVLHLSYGPWSFLMALTYFLGALLRSGAFYHA